MTNEDKSQKVEVSAQPAQQVDPQNAYSPLVDVYEEEDGTTVLVAEIPGAKADSVDVRVDKGVLTISAQAEDSSPGEDYSQTYSGFAGGQYYRAFALSDEVDREKIQARCAAGLLTLRLPRAESARTKRIDIRVD